MSTPWLHRILLVVQALMCLAVPRLHAQHAPGPNVVDLGPVLSPHAGTGAPGFAAAIVRSEGVVALGFAGVRAAGHEPRIEPDDLFHLGSCTKAMTATLAAMLVERGVIRWDSTIAESLPGLKGAFREEYSCVTLEQLLRHHSGLPGDAAMDRALWARMWSLSREPRELRPLRLEAAALILKQPPAANPGEVMAYTNLGYVIAGAMLEVAADASWEDLMRRELFGPLGMRSAAFGPPGQVGEKEPSQPWGHGREAKSFIAVPPGPSADNPAIIAPAGTVHASIEDWASFARLHLRGARGEAGLLLSPESFERIRTRQEGSDYALGWTVGTRGWAAGKPERTGIVLNHSGSNTMWFCTVWIAPERDLAIIVACNGPMEPGAKACDEVVLMLIAHAAVMDRNQR